MDYKKISELFGELSRVFAEYAGEVKNEDAPINEEKKDVKKSAKVKDNKKQEKDEDDSESLEEYLRKLSFSDLKKYAKEKGIEAKGKRDDIVARILEAETETEEEAEETEEVNSKVTSFKDKADDIREYTKKAEEILDEYEEDSIIEELKSQGIKGVTKKTLKDKIVEALKKGVLDFDGEDADEEEEEDDSDETIDENTYFEDFDDENEANKPENVSEKKRLKAMIKLQKGLLEDIDSEEIDEDTMKSFILENSTEDEQDEVEDLEGDDIICAYLELRKRMIDDEGDDMSESEDAYLVNGEVYAHGHACSEVDGKYIDEVSGEEFELE